MEVCCLVWVDLEWVYMVFTIVMRMIYSIHCKTKRWPKLVIVLILLDCWLLGFVRTRGAVFDASLLFSSYFALFSPCFLSYFASFATNTESNREAMETIQSYPYRTAILVSVAGACAISSFAVCILADMAEALFLCVVISSIYLLINNLLKSVTPTKYSCNTMPVLLSPEIHTFV